MVPLFYTTGNGIISLFHTLEIHQQIEGIVYLSIFLLLFFIPKTCESTWYNTENFSAFLVCI